MPRLKIVITQCAIKLYFLKYNMQKVHYNTTGFSTEPLNTATPTSITAHDLEVVSTKSLPSFHIISQKFVFFLSSYNSASLLYNGCIARGFSAKHFIHFLLLLIHWPSPFKSPIFHNPNTTGRH